MCQITPALFRELEDWKMDIRIRSAQLLWWLVLHAESDITQHTENILLAMYRICNQTDHRVIENVRTCKLFIYCIDLLICFLVIKYILNLTFFESFYKSFRNFRLIKNGLAKLLNSVNSIFQINAKYMFKFNLSICFSS